MIDISVVIPSYKTSFEIMEQTIKSVLSQKFQPAEIIVIDDNGGDDYSAQKQRIQTVFGGKLQVVFNEANRGANYSRNRGVNLASSSYVAFLDSDDTWSTDYLKNVVEVIKKNNAEFVTTNYQVVHEDGILPPTFDRVKFQSGNIAKKELFQDYVGPTSTVVISKNVIISAGLFDEQLPARQDYDMWIRVTKKVPVYYNYNPDVKVFRVGRTTISSSYKRNIQGTKMVLEKILKDDSLTRVEKEKIKSSHYKHMALSCILCGAYKESRAYAKQSLKIQLDKQLVVWFLLSLCPPFFNVMRMVRRHFLYKRK